jgi:hypothetical protein
VIIGILMYPCYDCDSMPKGRRAGREGHGLCGGYEEGIGMLSAMSEENRERASSTISRNA